MATFPRGSLTAPVWAHNRRVLRKASGQAQTSEGRVTWTVEPADDRLLRGLPCVGTRLGGAIKGTRPGDGLFR